MPVTTTLNGFNLRALGFITQEITGFRSAPGREIGKVPLPGTLGGVLLDGVVKPKLRSLSIVGTFSAESAILRKAAEDQLKGLAHAGLLKLVEHTPGALPRCTEVVLDGDSPLVPAAPVQGSRSSRWQIPLTAPLGVWQYLEPRQTNLVAANTPYPILGLGTAPSTLVVHLMGEATPIAPAIVLRDAWGRERARHTSEAAAAGYNLDDTHWAELDNRYGTIVVYRSGVAENGIAYFTPASDFPLLVDPNWGDPATGQNPTIEVTDGTGIAFHWPTFV
jgi:hypothetical protein